MDWEREKRKDERVASVMLILALAVIAAGIVFQDTVYPAVAAALQWFERAW